MRVAVGNFTLILAATAAILIAVGTILIQDKGYFGVLLAPISVFGTTAWCVAGVFRWRKWSMALLPIFVIPLLPWS